MAGKYVNIAGNLTKDPEAKTTPKGTVVELTVAVNERYDPETDRIRKLAKPEFYDVSVWGKPGQHALRSFHKGNRVKLDGSLEESTFTRDDGSEGVNRNITSNEVAASTLFADVAIAIDHSREVSGPSL